MKKIKIKLNNNFKYFIILFRSDILDGNIKLPKLSHSFCKNMKSKAETAVN